MRKNKTTKGQQNKQMAMAATGAHTDKVGRNIFISASTLLFVLFQLNCLFCFFDYTQFSSCTVHRFYFVVPMCLFVILSIKLTNEKHIWESKGPTKNTFFFYWINIYIDNEPGTRSGKTGQQALQKEVFSGTAVLTTT